MHKLQFICLHPGHITAAPDLDFLVIFLSLGTNVRKLWMGLDFMFPDSYLLTIYDHLQVSFKAIQFLKVKKCCFMEDLFKKNK